VPQHLRVRRLIERAIIWLAVLSAVVFGVWVAAFAHNGFLVFSIALLLLAIPFLWRKPVVGVYLLVAGAALFESFRLRFPDSLTDAVPFFRTISSLQGPFNVPLYPAEVILFLTLGIFAFQRIATRRTPLLTGPLFLPIAMLLAVMAFAILRGFAAG